MDTEDTHVRQRAPDNEPAIPGVRSISNSDSTGREFFNPTVRPRPATDRNDELYLTESYVSRMQPSDFNSLDQQGWQDGRRDDAQKDRPEDHDEDRKRETSREQQSAQIGYCYEIRKGF